MPYQQLVIVPCKGIINFCRVIFIAFVIITIIIIIWISAVQLQPNTLHPKTNQPNWMSIGSGMFVFSAYLDVRENHYYSERGVVALAVQKREQTLYCLLSDESGRTMCLQDPVRKVIMRKTGGYNYQHYFYICNLPSSAILPTFVSFSSDISCLETSPPIPVTQVHNVTNSSKEFGVCIESPLFSIDDAQFIIQIIEMNRILGAEWFTFYLQSASQAVMRVLEDYSREGVVDVVMSTIPNISVHYYGQQVLIQDCGYRNMYKVRYMIYTDLDELIVPQKHQNWSQMITEIDRKSIGGFQVRHVARSPEGFYNKLTVCNSSKEIEMPRYMTFTEQSAPFPIGKKSKFIIKPYTLAKVGIHSPGELLKGYYTYYVPSEIALLYHFRLPPRYTHNNVKDMDYKLAKYFPDLIARIEQRVCYVRYY